MHVPPPPSCRWLTDRVCYWLLGSLQKVSYDIKSLTKVETRATSYRRFNGWLPRVFFVWFAHPWSLTDVRWEEICWILRLWLNTKVCKGLRLSHEQRISMPCPFYVLVLIRYGRRIYWFFFKYKKHDYWDRGRKKSWIIWYYCSHNSPSNHLTARKKSDYIVFGRSHSQSGEWEWKMKQSKHWASDIKPKEQKEDRTDGFLVIYCSLIWWKANEWSMMGICIITQLHS